MMVQSYILIIILIILNSLESTGTSTGLDCRYNHHPYLGVRTSCNSLQL